MATVDGMGDRTITISGASKTFSVTGWRVGWIIAPPDLTGGIRKVHDFLTVGAAHPLQIAVASALELPASFYVELVGDYRERRDAIVTGLQECGFEATVPDGAYYVMAGIGGVWVGHATPRGGPPARTGGVGAGAVSDVLFPPDPAAAAPP